MSRGAGGASSVPYLYTPVLAVFAEVDPVIVVPNAGAEVGVGDKNVPVGDSEVAAAVVTNNAVAPAAAEGAAACCRLGGWLLPAGGCSFLPGSAGGCGLRRNLYSSLSACPCRVLVSSSVSQQVKHSSNIGFLFCNKSNILVTSDFCVVTSQAF